MSMSSFLAHGCIDLGDGLPDGISSLFPSHPPTSMEWGRFGCVFGPSSLGMGVWLGPGGD